MLCFCLLCCFFSVELILLGFGFSLCFFLGCSCLISCFLCSSLLLGLLGECFGPDLFFSELLLSSLLSPVLLHSLFKSRADLSHLLVAEASFRNSGQWINIFEDGRVASVSFGAVGAVDGPGVCGH